MQAVVSGLLTSYSRQGKGKQLLILHGWADPSANWQPFAAELAKKYDVITPDLPGFGGTQSPPTAWGLNDYADYVASFIAKLKLKPMVIIGHSNGGALAIRGLAAGVLSADNLVLLASAGVRGESNGRNRALRLVTKTGKALSAPLPVSTKRKLRSKLYASVGSDMLVAENLEETFKKVVEDDVRQDACNVSTQTLLIYGEQDTETPIRYGELFYEALPTATLEVIPDADHFLYRSHQAQVVKLIQDFLV